MNVMQLMSSSIDHYILPIQTVYPIADESRQQIRGLGLQITRSIPGTISRTLYSYTSHVKLLGKLALVAVTTVRRAPLEEIDYTTLITAKFSYLQTF